MVILLRKPSFHSERLDKIYPDHANALCKAGLAPLILPTMGELWENNDENIDIENKKESDINKKKNRNIYFFVACYFFYLYPQGDQQDFFLIYIG